VLSSNTVIGTMTSATQDSFRPGQGVAAEEEKLYGSIP
jgi:hypothetical protein